MCCIHPKQVLAKLSTVTNPAEIHLPRCGVIPLHQERLRGNAPNFWWPTYEVLGALWVGAMGLEEPHVLMGDGGNDDTLLPLLLLLPWPAKRYQVE